MRRKEYPQDYSSRFMDCINSHELVKGSHGFIDIFHIKDGKEDEYFEYIGDRVCKVCKIHCQEIRPSPISSAYGCPKCGLTYDL